MDVNTILLVEDNASDVDLTRRALARNRIDCNLVVASDGQEALDFLFGTEDGAVHEATRLPALILLDLNLPRVGGLDVLQQIRADPCTRRLPVVVLTSSLEEQDRAACYDLGANSYIRKPVDFVQFAEAIRQLGLYWLSINQPPPEVK